MNDRYPEQGRRRRMLEVIYGKLATSDQEVFILMVDEVSSIGARLGLNEAQSIRLLRSLVDDGLLRLSTDRYGNESWVVPDSGFMYAAVQDLTAQGRRMIGVLPTVDSVEGIVASLEELVRRIEESETLSPQAKSRQAALVRTLIGDLRQAAVGISAQELLKAFAQGIE